MIARGLGVSLLALAAATASAGVANAQVMLEDVVITAQRRSEDLQKAALAVTAISGDALQARGLTEMTQLGTVTTGVVIAPSVGPYTTFTIRGATNNSSNAFQDPSTAINLAGIYLSTPLAVHGLFYDLERVEVLKGPQGTLYGRNATAGAVNVIPHAPVIGEFGGDITVDVGSYDRLNFNGAVNVPLSERTAMRAAFSTVKREGYFSDGSGDEEGEAARVSFRFNASETLTATLIGDYIHQGGKGPGASVRALCGAVACFPAGVWTGIVDTPPVFLNYKTQEPQPFQDNNYYGLTLNTDWQVLGGTASLIAGYRESDINYLTLATGSVFRAIERPKQHSIEGRFASGDEGPLKYVLGLYYLANETQARTVGEQAAAYTDQHINLEGWTSAIFGQATYSLTDTFRLTGGLRYTYEEKSTNSRRYVHATRGPNFVIPAVPPQAPQFTNVQTRNWDATTWRAGVEWDPRPQSLVYANVSTGFRAGGYYYGVSGSDSFNPENITAYVIGTKNRFLDNRLQLNAELFHNELKDQQLSFVKLVNGGAAQVLVTENIGDINTTGVEVESEFLPFENTRIGLQAQWTDAEYKKFSYVSVAPSAANSRCTSTPLPPREFRVSCAGLRPPKSPEWTIVASAEQTVPLSNGAKLVGEIRARYESEIWTDINYIPQQLTFDTTRLDLSLTYQAPEDAWYVRGYVNNATDELTIANVGPFGGANLYPPRTYGVRVGAKF